MTLWRAVVCYFAAALCDLVWARYTLAVSAHKAVLSTFWAVGIILTGFVSIEAYTENAWYLLPVAAGAATGTYLTVRHARSAD